MNWSFGAKAMLWNNETDESSKRWIKFIVMLRSRKNGMRKQIETKKPIKIKNHKSNVSNYIWLLFYFSFSFSRSLVYSTLLDFQSLQPCNLLTIQCLFSWMLHYGCVIFADEVYWRDWQTNDWCSELQLYAADELAMRTFAWCISAQFACPFVYFSFESSITII